MTMVIRKAVHFPEMKGHTLLYGSTGTGKTTYLFQLLYILRELQLQGSPEANKVIVHCVKDDFIPTFYEPRFGDRIFAPGFDVRSASWTPWSEGLHSTRLLSVAQSIVQEDFSSDNKFWAPASQIVLASLLGELARQGKATNAELYRMLCLVPYEELADFLAGTVGGRHISKGEGARKGDSVLSTLVNHVQAFQFMPTPESTNDLFSIRDWILDPTPGILFVLSPAEYHATYTRSLVSVALDQAAIAIRALGDANPRKVWLIIDEANSAQRLPGCLELTLRGRSANATVLWSTQACSSMKSVWGEHDATTIFSNCSTKFIFRADDPSEADWCSRTLCSADATEVTRSESFGERDGRTRNTLSDHRIERRVVTPDELMTLPNYVGFLKFSGDWPIAKVKLIDQPRPRRAPAFVDALQAENSGVK